MTQDEFIEILDKEGYSYEIEGDKLVVTKGDYDWNIQLGLLTSIPPGVKFRNGGRVFLNSLKELPPDVEFSNKVDVSLDSLTSLPLGMEFNNKGNVYLKSLTSISPDVKFRNGGYVKLNSLIGEWVDEWEGNIEGIDSKRLLNVMIKKEMFI